jgi:hypothetical protein
MARLVVKTDVINIEPVKNLIASLERATEMRNKGASYKHTYRVLMTEYEVFKTEIARHAEESEVE